MAKKSFKGQVLAIATTTSTQDSGLLDILNPEFEKKTDANVKVLSKGTGGAIQAAIDKEVDLIFVHSRHEEDAFVADGYGVNRRDVMYNDFVVVGPPDDPAGIKSMDDAVAAFTKVKSSGEVGKTKFFSRSDRSGTHNKEISFWHSAGVKPALLLRGDWYVTTGKGMGETLKSANSANAYTLTDRGTWLKMKGALDKLRILVQGPLKGGDPRLMNHYGIIAVNPLFNPKAKYELAMAYIAFVTSIEGQNLIADYKFNGDQLFVPDAK